ncbi:ATP synthase subunit b [Gammaproteobacteria bacterium]
MDPKVILAALPEILTQLVAFLVVFLILKKYAFGAIFRTLDERQEKIASSIQEAEDKRLEFESLKKEYEQKLQDIGHEGRVKMQAAVAEAEQIAEDIRERARADVAVQLERAKQEIQRETESARASMRQEVVELSSLIAGKLIAKNLTDADNEKYVLELLSHTERLS